MKLKIISILSLTVLIATACKKEKNTTVKEQTATAITLEKLENSPEYATASLKMLLPLQTKSLATGKTNFNFEVTNYNLEAQTKGENAQILANSNKGQHIHFILNNQPYSAHYKANFEKEIPEGVHHLVAFLSRSYHESVKNKNSVVVKKLVVGENAKDTHNLDIDAPTLIYSRPKGTYKGKDTESLLLDFFVLNTTLSKDGNKVRATINNTEFIITEWSPQVIKGLPKGDVAIKLELIDAKGNQIPGPFNSVKRMVTLKE